MFKKMIAALLTLMLLGGLVSCVGEQMPDDDTSTDSETETEEGTEENTESDTTDDKKDEEDDGKPEPIPTTVALNSSTKGIKILGDRMLESDSQINCDWTCSGIEFVIESTGGSLTIKADSDAPCYFRAYVDGVEWVSASGGTYHEVSGDSTIKLPAIPKGTHTIRVIKVTGHTLARAELKEMTFFGTLSETAPEKKELYIEFIGDSISCGWGIMGTKDGKYTGQDGTMAYPYLVAQALDADYSITALSGQGLVFSGANMPNITNGYLLCSPIRDGSTAYEFERKADVVVINIGTNDFSKGVNEAEFKAAYKALIGTIREKNGADCKVVCIYNTMNDTFSSAILEACREMGGMSKGVYSLKFTKAQSGHPTASENLTYLADLKPVIENALSYVPPVETPLTVEASGTGKTADIVADFKSFA